MRRIRRWRWTGMLAVLLAVSFVLLGCRTGKEQADAAPRPTEEQLASLRLLNETAAEMYQKVMRGDLEGGRVGMQQISDQVTQLGSFEGVATVEGMNALTEAIVQAKRALASVQGNVGAAQIAAAKVHLATDALTHPSQPMWLQYYSLLQEDVELLERSAAEGNKASLRQGASRLDQHYAIVRPSLLISRSLEDVTRMDSLNTFISNQSDAEDPFKNIENVILPLRQTIDRLFMKKETTAYLPIAEPRNPIIWTLAFGSAIIAALTFAGWRLAQKEDSTPLGGPGQGV